jgi:hypothetical protein
LPAPPPNGETVALPAPPRPTAKCRGDKTSFLSDPGIKDFDDMKLFACRRPATRDKQWCIIESGWNLGRLPWRISMSGRNVRFLRIAAAGPAGTLFLTRPPIPNKNLTDIRGGWRYARTHRGG